LLFGRIDGKRIAKIAKWGLIPRWAKDDKIQYSMHNARSEEFTTKPAFRDAWQRGQRCLCVTNGFYEWKQLGLKGRKKQACRIGLRICSTSMNRIVQLLASDEPPLSAD
jgi:putative SOS response-associated peptidase YedK